ncbi:MAG TPA: HD domain-containing phosphohydrolase [Smithella sp.]|nr:HD domain-containing phosphohydrolase [Smithella sp.]
MKEKIRTIFGNIKNIKTVKKKTFLSSESALSKEKEHLPGDDVSLRMFTIEALNSFDAERYRHFLQNIQEEYFELDLAGKFTFFNRSVCRVLGYSAEELMGMNYGCYMANKEIEKEIFQAFNKVYKSEEPLKEHFWQITRKDGARRHIEGSLSLKKDPAGKSKGFIVIARDITRRRQAEEKFHKIFMTTPDCIVITRMKDGLILDVNTGFEEITGWKTGYAIGRTAYEINFWNDTADRVFMTGELRAGRDILQREFQFRRCDGSVRAGIYSARSINLNSEGCVIFILRDITESRQMYEELNRTLDILRKGIGTTIAVMTSAIEMRDPYTAGHQKKSADVARAIATEMGFTPEKIDGIRMAGTIHDIGKLSIPAEILSKPTKLTDIEYSLIKQHSMSGYEMLKDIESPWPLAEIVYQHHERMDGSGYPRHLKGDEIIMEARIIAVADVVEAMASHRPYRASLGIDAALREIEKNKGILYDNVVVDACLRLFRHKGFQII